MKGIATCHKIVLLGTFFGFPEKKQKLTPNLYGEMMEYSKHGQELVGQIYDRILEVANGILYNAKNFSIEILRMEDPTYEQIAEQLGDVCKVMESISLTFVDDYTISKAREYVVCIRNIAQAINENNETNLLKFVEDLDRRPFS